MCLTALIQSEGAGAGHNMQENAVMQRVKSTDFTVDENPRNAQRVAHETENVKKRTEWEDGKA